MKPVISIFSLFVLFLIAGMTLLFDTRVDGHLTAFGYSVAVLIGSSLILGVAAEIHAIREKARDDAENASRHLEQKHQIGRLETEMSASIKPLLPLAIFYTLRHTPEAEALDKMFAGVEGFKTIKPGMLRFVGTARLGGVLHYNSIEARADHSQSVLEGEELQERFVKFGHGSVRSPSQTFVDFFFPEDGKYPEEPSLTLQTDAASDGRPHEIKRIELFDDVIFQDAFVNTWKARTRSGVAFSVASLADCRLRVRFQFLGEHGPVALHNLHLFFGPPTMMHGMFFPEDMLSQATFTLDSNQTFVFQNDLARQFFVEHLLTFECLLSGSVLSERLVRIVTH